MTAEFSVLGPVEVRLDGALIPIGPRQQATLALLLVEANRLVTLDQMLEWIWVEKRPTRPANAVQTQLTLLRRSLAPMHDVVIAWQTGGYRLTIDEATIDLHRFRDLVRKARNTTNDELAAEHWTAAFGLWRGDPFTGVELPWFTATRTNLLAEHEAAALDHADTLLRLGHYDALLASLEARAAQRPLDERLAGQLMLALHGAGRTDEALRHYDDLSDRLVNELGADPGTPLQELRQRVRTNTTHANSVPRQLPAAPGAFTGRTDELTAMTKILDNATETGGTVIISAIAGTGGIGKTWLTLHWAHQQRDRFPDGQLFVDLRGFSPGNQPLLASVAMSGFLETLGIPPDRMPSSLDAQAALWRTLMADKRMLIVLDNAANTEQVLPLLPGGSTNTVLVNSRDRLSGLTTGHGAHRLMLDALTDAEARDLLRTRLGTERLAAEPQAVDQLLTHCAGFPLALSIIAGRALSHPDFPLATLVTELREHRLLALDDAEPTASLPSVLSWSYHALTAEQARTFGLLGVAPGPDISVDAAASLINRPRSETRTLLRALERASLLRQHVPGRYRMHDLVLAYAREQVGPETEPALRRVVDFYLRTAVVGERIISPSRLHVDLAPLAPGAQPLAFDDHADALAWYVAELDCLLATQAEAIAHGWDEHVWRFGCTITMHLTRTGRTIEDLASCRAGLAAALRLGDAWAEARTRQALGATLGRTELFGEALSELAESIRIAAAIGEPAIEAHAERAYARACDQMRDHRSTRTHTLRALELFEQIGNPLWIVGEINNVGWAAGRLGDFETARVYCERALELQGKFLPTDQSGGGHVYDSLGYIATETGRYAEAIEYFDQARKLYAAGRNTFFDAETLDQLGRCHREIGQLDEARAAWEQARRIYQDCQRPTEVARISDLLDALPSD